jgi:hypothetical protein
MEQVGVARRDRSLRHILLTRLSRLTLNRAARAERRLDCAGVLQEDAGIERAVDAAVGWLCRAQDCSASADGGIARHYSLINGWGPSYPETTGYIIPTLLTYARLKQRDDIRERTRRMLAWLVAIQHTTGGFQGGAIGRLSPGPVTFNTGQILIGLAIGAREFPQYRDAMYRAADWLVQTQDRDGCWRKYPTPFAAPGEKAYETHVAWGLLEAARVSNTDSYAEAALANIRWALGAQRENGWFEKCCLADPRCPLTHTIGYALRGMVEAYRFFGDEYLLAAAKKTADGLLSAMGADGFLPGRLGPNWDGNVDWACLTGTVQIAHCWLSLFQFTGESRYRDAAHAANAYVRRTVRVDGPPDTRGAVKGSFPVSGNYGAYQYLNWACKFFIDSNMLEKKVNEQTKQHSPILD